MKRKYISRLLIEYHESLRDDWVLPKDVELIFPFRKKETLKVVSKFYTKFFNDSNERILLFGINPGRHGAGVTGIPFTDPIKLENECGIKNTYHKRMELSADFVYRLIERMGGPKEFYKHFLISSICPLGFIANGVNINYYDDKKLQESVMPYILEHLQKHLDFGCSNDVAFSLGKGKNFKMLKSLNDKHGFFNRVEALPHPRWVMQYRRKFLDDHLNQISKQLETSIK